MIKITKEKNMRAAQVEKYDKNNISVRITDIQIPDV